MWQIKKPWTLNLEVKMSKLGPKFQYFVWPPLFSSTALTLLGMEFTRSSQVATGVLFHSTSRSWWMLETLRSPTFRLMMPHRLPLPSASLARQWSSWRCFWGRYHVGILPCGPVSEREGIMLCFSMSQYMLAFMVPSMNCSSPVPAALMQPQIMTSCRPIWCRVWSMVWALTGWPPTPSTSAAMLAAVIRLFPKHNLWIWCWACTLNFIGWPWRGLF